MYMYNVCVKYIGFLYRLVIPLPFSFPQSMTLLQKKLASVEEELLEVRGAMEEGSGREGEWRENREHLQSDLEAAETRVEAAYSEVEKEKAMRWGLHCTCT